MGKPEKPGEGICSLEEPYRVLLGRMVEGRGRRTEGRRQRTDDRGQTTEDRRQTTDDRGVGIQEKISGVMFQVSANRTDDRVGAQRVAGKKVRGRRELRAEAGEQRGEDGLKIEKSAR